MYNRKLLHTPDSNTQDWAATLKTHFFEWTGMYIACIAPFIQRNKVLWWVIARSCRLLPGKVSYKEGAVPQRVSRSSTFGGLFASTLVFSLIPFKSFGVKSGLCVGQSKTLLWLFTESDVCFVSIPDTLKRLHIIILPSRFHRGDSALQVVYVLFPNTSSV